MPNNRMNKTIAGYHLLMILSAIDYRVNGQKDMIIRNYLAEEFPFNVNLDKQMDVISNLNPSQWENHYRKAMDDFYDDATPAERKKLLQFALQLAKADNVITKEENHYLDLLFEHWEDL
jgi:hypothetical protein